MSAPPTTTSTVREAVFEDGDPSTQLDLVDSIRMSLRAGIGAGIALLLANWLNLPYPIYAMVSAIMVTDLSASGTRALAVPRLLGDLMGAFLGAVFSLLLPPGAASIGFGIFVAMLISYLTHLHQAAKLTGFVCGIVMLSYGDSPWSYAFFRLLETSLGICVAGAISLFPKVLRNFGK